MASSNSIHANYQLVRQSSCQGNDCTLGGSIVDMFARALIGVDRGRIDDATAVIHACHCSLRGEEVAADIDP